MSGRPIAAAPQLFAEFIRVPHTGMSAPRKTVFLANIEPTAQKVANGDAIHYLEVDVRLAGGRGGGETPPAPTAQVSQYFVAGFLLIQTQTWHNPSKRPLFLSRAHFLGKKFQKRLKLRCQ